MENIFILGGALLAAHMLTKGGGDAISELFSGGGSGGGATGAGMFQSEEEIDADAYMRGIRDERSYENQKNPFGDLLSGLFGDLFDQGTGEKIDPELTSDDDLGIVTAQSAKVSEIQEAHGFLTPEKGGNLFNDPFQLPATFEGLKAEMPVAVGLEYDFDTGAVFVDAKSSQMEKVMLGGPLYIAESNVSSVPFTLQGTKYGTRDSLIFGAIDPDRPVTGVELIQASQAGYGNVIEWRNAQDN